MPSFCKSLIISALAALAALAALPIAAAQKDTAPHWAYQPLADPPVIDPSVNIIDHHIDAAHTARGITAVPPALPQTLLRRAYFGLHGLPPTPQQQSQFFKGDRSFSDLVDDLLDSPHYGERWGRHWLDVARYADSLGYRYDDDIPHAYTYRDFVIQALNADQPYDEFIRWQLAGDELAPNDRDALAATGFLGVGARPRIEGTKLNKLDARYIEIDDMVGTTFTGFLGLSMSCARCHDHKFDTLSQREYYGVAKAFLSGKRGSHPHRTPPEHAQWALWESQKAAYDQRFSDWQERHSDALDTLVTALRAPLAGERAALEAEVISQLEEGDEPDDAAHLRRIIERQGKRILGPEKHGRWNELRRKMESLRRRTLADEKRLQDSLSPEAFSDWAALRVEKGELDEQRPPDSALCLAYDDTTSTPVESPLMARGSVASPSDPVPLMMPAAVGLQPWHGKIPDIDGSTGQRAALAKWITDPRSGAGHLLARVIVNRVWSKHFGTGLVRTIDDFGVQGDPPHLPALLDHLATALIANDWSLKWLHRHIMASRTYQRSGGIIAASQALDPENLTWWRKPALRLEGEILRDAMLTVSDRMNPKMHGPGVMLPIPKEVIISRLGKAYPSDIADGEAVWRRSIYAFHKRTVPVPFFRVFDSPSASESCGHRIETNVPTQALVIMNNDFVRRRAADLATRLSQMADPIGSAFQICFARPVTSQERANSEQFLADYPSQQKKALTDFAQALMGANEFIFID